MSSAEHLRAGGLACADRFDIPFKIDSEIEDTAASLACESSNFESV